MLVTPHQTCIRLVKKYNTCNIGVDSDACMALKPMFDSKQDICAAFTFRHLLHQFHLHLATCVMQRNLPSVSSILS